MHYIVKMRKKRVIFRFSLAEKKKKKKKKNKERKKGKLKSERPVVKTMMSRKYGHEEVSQMQADC